MTLVWLIVAIVIVALLAARYGSDSRDGQDWQPLGGARWTDRPARRRHTIATDLRALLTRRK